MRAPLFALAVFGVAGCDGWGLAAPAATTSSGGLGGSSGAGGSAGAPSSGGGGEGGQAQGGQAQGSGGAGGEALPSPDCSPPAGALPGLSLEIVAAGLEQPVGLEAAPGDPERLFVLEKTGRIKVIENGVLLPTPFLDLSAVTWAEGEAGLLALGFHPQYAENGRFFVYYTQAILNGAHLAEFRRSDADPNLADPLPVGAPLIEVLPAHIHNGGSIELSPIDGYLYFSLGERGTAAWAQQLDTLLGKLLRIDVSTTPYSIPPGNLPGGLPEIWDYGLRNPWRMAFDPCTGELYIGDVGALEREEIDIEQPGMGHHNYGWPILEGTQCYPTGTPCDPTGLTPPAHELSHGPPDNFHVMIGGVVYRGSAIPALRGMYLFADTWSGLRGLRYSGGRVTQTADFSLDVLGLLSVPVSIGQDLAGEVYVVDLQREGRVLKLVPR
jgi:glucose/arabinose dehydrogenase